MIFTVQCVNAFMLYLVYVDIDMYDDTTDTCAEPRSTIVTDLGQIQYIFTDKTGTLTQNVMRFKRCSIDGTLFLLCYVILYYIMFLFMYVWIISNLAL
jgi:phospholipid-transporting ATPase